MAQKSAVRQHAMYVPRPPVRRPVARSHAWFMEGQPASCRQARRARQIGRGGWAAGPAAGMWPLVGFAAAILICALGGATAALALALSALLRQPLHDPVAQSVFPFLLGGTILILLRGQVSARSYHRLCRCTGLVTGLWTDHVLAVLYILVLFLATTLLATLLAGGAALLIVGFLGR